MLSDSLKKSIVYEWAIEEVDEYGDILDYNHSTFLNEFQEHVIVNDVTFRLVLVRDVLCPLAGMVDRSWAEVYTENGKRVLSEMFKGGTKDTKVPKRFHEELNCSKFNIAR